MRGGAKPGVRGKWAEEILTPGFADVPQCTIIKTSAPVRILKGAEKRKVGGRRTISGFIEKKGACDYEGGFRGLACAIEAKRWDLAARDRWNFKSSIAEHQQDRMMETAKMGGLAGVLLCVDGFDEFAPPAWFGIEWWAIHVAKMNFEKSLSIHNLIDRRIGKWPIFRVRHTKLSRIDIHAWLVEIFNRAKTGY